MKRKLFISLGILAAVLIAASVAVYLFVPHQCEQLDALKHRTSEHGALQQGADSAIGTDSTTAVSQTPNYAEMLEEQNILYQYHNDSLERTFYEIYDIIEDWRKSKIIVLTHIKNNTTECEVIGGNLMGYNHFYIDPDERYFYSVGIHHNNSNGWICNYFLLYYDLRTGECGYVFDGECAAIKVDKNGFTLAEARLTNEATATCTADEIWLMHDVHIGWDGHLIAISKQEYDWETMAKRFGTNETDDGYPYLKGFYSSINRPEK